MHFVIDLFTLSGYPVGTFRKGITAMTNRITIKTLRSLVDRLNTMTGNPTTIWTRDETGNHAHVGAYILDCAYGGYLLAQIVSDGGGERNITMRDTSRATFHQIYAYMNGLERGRACPTTS